LKVDALKNQFLPTHIPHEVAFLVNNFNAILATSTTVDRAFCSDHGVLYHKECHRRHVLPALAFLSSIIFHAIFV